ncbi:isochorismatase family protein [Agrobacterium sp.]|uniref:isochorismatase family protein n=1 Tax=Agrobacterium sp. TaxID=361 RepID=UPI0028AA88F4|nr:isochorismatase family protein [Agrobacterium sp.]
MAKTALIIIDMQMDMQQRIEAGRDHVNGDAPEKITALATAFRAKGHPVLHIRHAENNPASSFHPDAPGYQPMPCAEEAGAEPIFVKNTSSGFASTDLAEYLRSNGIEDLVVTGAVAGFCVNSTVRAGADIGFRMTVVRDAVLGFDLPSANLSAQTIFDVTMAHLEADFARVVDTKTLLAG